MKHNKIVLAGGNGYLGQVLAKHFSPITDEVVILSRKPRTAKGNIKTIVWNGQTKGEWVKAFENSDLLINLCGKNVNYRYTVKNKEEIIQSRLQPTVLLGKVIQNLANPPKLWINITSATIYRHAEDRYQDEIHGEMGTGFSVEVCKAWESCFFESATPKTRKIALRMGIVLGKADGAFPRLLNLVKTGLGGKQGNGQQYVSWVHEQDAALSIEWLLQQDKMAGIINCTAPEPVKNHMLMSEMRKVYGINFGLSTPAWLLAIGAKMIGTETELILKSRWVRPTAMLNGGFEFKYPTIEVAVEDILK